MNDEERLAAKAIIQGIAGEVARELGAQRILTNWESRTDGSVDGLLLVVTVDGPTFTTTFAEEEFQGCLANDGARQQVHDRLRELFRTTTQS